MANMKLPPGARWLPAFLDEAAQKELYEEIAAILREAPLFRPQMPRTGRPFSVRMSNCGELGWVSDRQGYRYQHTHPVTGRPWPPMPQLLIAIWSRLSGCALPAQACLINYYEGKARMGLHQDRDEKDFSAPVVSLSLGDSCIFRIGGLKRNEPTVSFRLDSGDAVILGGQSRLAFHGVDRILPGSSTLLPEAGRINLTLRRVE